MTTALHKNLLQKIKRGAQQLRQPTEGFMPRDKSKNKIIFAYGKCGRTLKKPHMFAINWKEAKRKKLKIKKKIREREANEKEKKIAFPKRINTLSCIETKVAKELRTNHLSNKKNALRFTASRIQLEFCVQKEHEQQQRWRRRRRQRRRLRHCAMFDL